MWNPFFTLNTERMKFTAMAHSSAIRPPTGVGICVFEERPAVFTARAENVDVVLTTHPMLKDPQQQASRASLPDRALVREIQRSDVGGVFLMIWHPQKRVSWAAETTHHRHIPENNLPGAPTALVSARFDQP